MGQPRLCFYGDDFTGSIDVLLQLARCNLSSKLYLSVEHFDVGYVAGSVDAVGIAGTARSLGPEAMRREVLPALSRLHALGPRFIQYKACSTADSSPTVGSLGLALELGRSVVGPAPVPVLFAQPDFGRYTVFGNHFAAERGVVYRLDRQPTMAHHPSTPMDEADLRQHLSRQTDLRIGSVTLESYGDLTTLTDRLAGTDADAVVMDALDDSHLLLAAQAIAATSSNEPRFVVGSGGLTSGLARTLSPRTGVDCGSEVSGPDGPVLAVSGSRSGQTARQIDAAVAVGWALVDLSWDVDDSRGADQAIALLQSGVSVVAVPSGEAPVSDPINLLSAILANVVRRAVSAGATQRVVVCGGDTSSHVMRDLGGESLRIIANPIDNLTLCALESPLEWLDGLEIALKGGQVGPADYLEFIRLAGPVEEAAGADDFST